MRSVSRLYGPSRSQITERERNDSPTQNVHNYNATAEANTGQPFHRMYFVFADDAKQDRPSRQGTGPLVAAGAILVPGNQLKHLETVVQRLCQKHHFPVTDPRKSEFKWSPGPELWMYRYLLWPERETFFLSVIEFLRRQEQKRGEAFPLRCLWNTERTTEGCAHRVESRLHGAFRGL